MPQQKELQCGGNKSTKERGASRWWQKWELQHKLLSLLPLLFFLVKKITMMLSSSFSISSSCYEEKDNDGAVIVLFLLLQR